MINNPTAMHIFTDIRNRYGQHAVKRIRDLESTEKFSTSWKMTLEMKKSRPKIVIRTQKLQRSIAKTGGKACNKESSEPDLSGTHLKIWREKLLCLFSSIIVHHKSYNISKSCVESVVKIKGPVNYWG